MKLHPAALMLLVWLSCVAIFYTLPFRLEGGRVMTLYGYLILLLFIGVFCLGALAAARPQAQRPRPANVVIDFLQTDRILMAAGIIAVLSSLLDIQGRDILDLADAYKVRSDSAAALLAGGQSASSIWFQISFLTYPAGYVYIVREVAFRNRPQVWRLAAFGIAPVLLTSLAMGGRAPLFYALVMLIYGFALRKQHIKPMPKVVPGRDRSRAGAHRRPFKLNGPAKAGIGVLSAIVAVYFVQVFSARADVGGGLDAMFGIAELSWGVSFNGRFSQVFYSLFGVEGTYMIFVFSWYLIQGLVMSNTIFSNYDGPMMLGTYGVDLVAAVIRRLNGEFIANGYAVLFDLNTYGFLPSAFASMFVDLHFFALIPCLIWGWMTGKVYGYVKRGQDPRWIMTIPFVTVGIVFSLINSPIGFSNGFVTHLWLVAAFLSARPVAEATRPT